ncbi:MAG: double-strand break repair helicase AddA [Micavibrio sp.]|nr:double-strand break repair helicase AddA [Micavibrio sp.]
MSMPQQKSEASRRQSLASNPYSSVWVGASAGTGKTKVLTDRVLRLLLPDADGQGASDAHKILCLTFTKAGASEMSNRISGILSKWAVQDEAKLRQTLADLLDTEPSDKQIEAARKLFAGIVDMRDGLKIMTIHSFCQSVLGRFPLEAGLLPNFRLVDEVQAAIYKKQALRKTLDLCRDDEELSAVLARLASVVRDDDLEKLFSKIISEQRSFKEILEKNFGLDGLYTALCAMADVPAGTNPEDILLDSCDDKFVTPELKNIVDAMSESRKPTDVNAATVMLPWYALSQKLRAKSANFNAYYKSLITDSKNTPRVLPTADIIKIYPDAKDVLAKEAQRLIDVRDCVHRLHCVHYTLDLCRMAEVLLGEYARIKKYFGVVDFDDIILKTLELMRGKNAKGQANIGWVQYKLDQGLDHILVDEAQDTNPEQWSIIESLSDEFFSGDGARNINRTIFVVGDEKQSIYSFQRASPADFHEMYDNFSNKVVEAGKVWTPVHLNTSFRTTSAVLRSVDAVFSRPEMQEGVSKEPIIHVPHRAQQAGRVELWPLYVTDKNDDESDLWSPITTEASQQSGGQKLAKVIAERISEMVHGREILPSRGRAIEPKDIMILVRRRGALVAQISKALKNADVPVSGLDRLVPAQQLAVQDLLAAAKFAQFTGDDLTFACFLKSPIIGLDEQSIFDISYGRKGSLWEALRAQGDVEIVRYLEQIIALAKGNDIYAFFSFLLQKSCPGSAVSGRQAMIRRLGVDSHDALDEFLNSALQAQQMGAISLQQFVFEQERVGTEIKREMDEGQNQVRILTVHGSKGLEAPIVFLPDTTSAGRGANSKAEARLLWPNKLAKLDLPFWKPNSNFNNSFFTNAAGEFDATQDQERRRLLYVAMTRAEDRLYICGAQGKNAIDKNSWYNMVKDGLADAPDVVEHEDGRLILDVPMAANVAPDRPDKAQQGEKEIYEIPDWVHAPLPEENPLSQDYLAPSKLAEVAISPREGGKAKRFLRGNLTHKLLQLLPDMAKDKHEDAMRSYLRHYGADLSEDVRENIFEEISAILNNPDFGRLFGPNSRAEVPISARVEGKGIISGQIDRLFISNDEVFFVDYKTNRPSPLDPADIAPAYILQIQAYGDVLARLYPERNIRGALLWTDSPRITEIDLHHKP